MSLTYVKLQDLRFTRLTFFNMRLMILLHYWKNIWDVVAVHGRLKLDLNF